MKPLGDAAVHRPEPQVVDQAIDWLVRLQSGEASSRDWEDCRRWREARPAHSVAWDRLQGIQGRFAGLPAAPAIATLDRAQRDMNRRKVLRTLSVVLGGGVAAWVAQSQMPVDRLLVDYSTGVGEQRRVTLADGTLLLLNTATAVNVRFDEDSRRLDLREGQIALTTGADAQATRYRPLTVATGHGLVRALGTRFQVRRDADATRVQVLEHAVELQPSGGGAPRVLQAGQQAWFDADGVHDVAALDPDSDAWRDGVLVAREMPLADFVAELKRYRPGRLGCEDSVAGLRISGVFSLTDTDRTLALVEKTLPIRVVQRTRYWVTLQRRS